MNLLESAVEVCVEGIIRFYNWFIESHDHVNLVSKSFILSAIIHWRFPWEDIINKSIILIITAILAYLIQWALATFLPYSRLNKLTKYLENVRRKKDNKQLKSKEESNN